MPEQKRWSTIIIYGILTGIAAWLGALLTAGVTTWREAFELRLVLPGLIAMIGAWIAFYQPSTVEGAQAAKRSRGRSQ